jgi:hypothetical protein
MNANTPRAAARRTGPKIRAGRRILAVGTCVLVLNLLIYSLGHASGGSFTYRQNGRAIKVDATAVTILTLGPLAIGLAMVALLARKRPVLISVATIVAPLLAVATIGLMTIPAHFDATSTLSLALMHIALIPAVILCLRALANNRDRVVSPTECDPAGTLGAGSSRTPTV